MSRPVLHLPLVQNWDCHGCSNCCREYLVVITEAERARIALQGWEADPAMQGIPIFQPRTWWQRSSPALNHQPDGRCVFLNDQGRCRIHERFGAEAKPLTCRVFPFVFVPAGEQTRLGVRFACPSAAANRGRPVTEQEEELRSLAETVALRRECSGLPPLLLPGYRVDWPDVLRLTSAVAMLLGDRRDPLDRRLRKVLALIKQGRQATLGSCLAGFLGQGGSNLDSEVPSRATALAPPGWMGRILFRQTLAIYIRQDQGPDRGIAAQSVGRRMQALWTMTRGRGEVPRLHARLPQVTFEQLESAHGAWPEQVELTLERYFLVKVESLQFCGPTNFGMSFLDGLESLALTYPVILWLARALAPASGDAAAVQALGIVDNQFGFNRLLGGARQRLSLRMLVKHGELEKLIAWYSR